MCIFQYLPLVKQPSAKWKWQKYRAKSNKINSRKVPLMVGGHSGHSKAKSFRTGFKFSVFHFPVKCLCPIYLLPQVSMFTNIQDEGYTSTVGPWWEDHDNIIYINYLTFTFVNVNSPNKVHMSGKYSFKCFIFTVKCSKLWVYYVIFCSQMTLAQHLVEKFSLQFLCTFNTEVRL